MRRESFPGGSYCEAQPDRRKAVLFADERIVTQRGPLALKDGVNPLYLRLSPVNDQISGQGHSTGLATVWTGAEWVTAGPAHGVSPVAFWPDGRLEVSTGAQGYGSQGIRWIDDRVHTGDETYASVALGLHEFTTHGDISIGQGSSNGGVVIVRGPQRKRLGVGLCFFIRFNRAGDQLAVAWWEKVGNGTTAHLAWLTVPEIAALPDDVIPQPVPVPQPQPEPVPMPEIPNLFPTVTAVWQKYGGENRGAMLNEIAWTHRADGWGLSRKTGGHHVLQPTTGERIASDVVQHQPSGTLWDVFSDTGPIWAQAGPHNDPSRIWLPPVAPDGATVPTPGPSLPNPGTPDLSEELNALRTEVARLRELIESEGHAFVGWAGQVSRRLDAIENRPLPPLVARGRTSRDRWHAHDVELDVVPK